MSLNLIARHYPNAYCVKCGTHTETQKKHTVVLQNSARALRGICPACETEVYKILPKLKDLRPERQLTPDEKRRYPDAFCVKCQAHTPTVNAHTVILDNASRAVTGSCRQCGSEVYRIIGHRSAEKSVPASKPSVRLRSTATANAAKAPMAAGRRSEDASLGDTRWSFVLAVGVMISIITAFMILAIV